MAAAVSMDKPAYGSMTPVGYDYDSSLASMRAYHLSPISVTAPPPPSSSMSVQPLTPLTPLTPINDLSTSSEYFGRRESYPSERSKPNWASSSASASATSGPSYTSPSYSDEPSPMQSSGGTVSRRASDPAAVAQSPTSSDYDLTSPLTRMPETDSNINIPPLAPPSVQWPQHAFDDWDSLPDLLRQDRKADYSPRRPMNIYFIYMRVRRPELAHHNPNLSTGDLSKLLGKEWNGMSPDQKAPWNELAERLMRSFKKKFPDYQYERGGGKKMSKKMRPRSAPTPLSLVQQRGMMMDGSVMRRPSHPHHGGHSHPYYSPPHHQQQYVMTASVPVHGSMGGWEAAQAEYDMQHGYNGMPSPTAYYYQQSPHAQRPPSHSLSYPPPQYVTVSAPADGTPGQTYLSSPVYDPQQPSPQVVAQTQYFAPPPAPQPMVSNNSGGGPPPWDEYIMQ